jgi:micrococcal nuclease
MYEYQARCVEVVDGDAQDVVVDLGFHLQRQIRLRLAGVDHDSEEYRRGKEETEFVAAWLDEAATQHDGEWPLIVRTEKKGKYGRYLATIERRADGAVLNETLRQEFDGVDARNQEGS